MEEKLRSNEVNMIKNESVNEDDSNLESWLEGLAGDLTIEKLSVKYI